MMSEKNSSDSTRLGDLLEALMTAGATGRLRVSLEGTEISHALFLRDGEIVRSATSSSIGEAALSSLLDACSRSQGLWFQFDRTASSSRGDALPNPRPLLRDAPDPHGDDPGDHGTQRVTLRDLGDRR